MIFSRIVGGLGNQLFQIAACLKYRKLEEKIIISFLGDIHIPKRENCLDYIFEKPDWIYYDDSKNLNHFTKFNAKNSLLILDKNSKEKIFKSIKNIPNVKATDVNHFNAFDIVKYKKLIITETAVKEIEKRYS